MNRTPIEWTDWSCNPLKMKLPNGDVVNVCVHKSEGCRHCYAESIVRHFWKKEWQTNYGDFPGYTPALLKLGEPVLVEKELEAVLRLSERIASGKADPSENKIFWNDMTDEYLDFWPDELLDKIWAVRALTPNLIHQVLTKRAERMRKYLSGENCRARHYQTDLLRAYGGSARRTDIRYEMTARDGGEGYNRVGGLKWPLPNVWLGVSVEDQKTADERIPWLLKTPAAVRWVSYEPALGPVDFRALFAPSNHLGMCVGESPKVSLRWCVVGGESGPGARPMHPEWARSARDQCVAAGVKFFFKQWGAWLPRPFEGITQRDIDRERVCIIAQDGHLQGGYGIGSAVVESVGKKLAGRILDGRTWDEYPD